MDTKIPFDETDLAKTQVFVERGAGSRFAGTPENIRMGKLGEIAFAKFLFANGKVLRTRFLFANGKEGWINNDINLTMEGVYVRPRLYLHTADGASIDVKTSKRRSILVPGDRKESYYSRYYVGVQISVDWKTGTIRGFVGLPGLRESDIVDGCYQKNFESLVDIGKLLEMMHGASGR